MRSYEGARAGRKAGQAVALGWPRTGRQGGGARERREGGGAGDSQQRDSAGWGREVGTTWWWGQIFGGVRWKIRLGRGWREVGVAGVRREVGVSRLDGGLGWLGRLGLVTVVRRWLGRQVAVARGRQVGVGQAEIFSRSTQILKLFNFGGQFTFLWCVVGKRRGAGWSWKKV